MQIESSKTELIQDLTQNVASSVNVPKQPACTWMCDSKGENAKLNHFEHSSVLVNCTSDEQ